MSIEHSFSSRGCSTPLERADAKPQPDLFGARGRAHVHHLPQRSARAAAPAPESLSDDELIALFADPRRRLVVRRSRWAPTSLEDRPGLRFGFYAYFDPMSCSANSRPGTAGFDVHSGYEANPLTALETMESAGLRFARSGIAQWDGIWQRAAGPATKWSAAAKRSSMRVSDMDPVRASP